MEETTCQHCKQEIFWTGHRWAGVYKLTNGDTCMNVETDYFANDHEPEATR